MNDLDSFTEVTHWDRLFDEASSQPPVRKYLIGLKTDLPTDQRTVSQEMSKELAEKKGYSNLECSVIRNDGYNIDSLMN